MYSRHGLRLAGTMKQSGFATLCRCACAIALAFLLPAWLLAIPVVLLSVAAAYAIVRSPTQAAIAMETIKAILAPPE